MTQKISSERQAAYYFGLLVIVFGSILFLSVIVSLASTPFGSRPALGLLMGRALGGVALIAIGAAARRAGAAGLAGSGLVLDPERARRELEPFSRMAGGMAKDALDEAGVSLGQEPQRIVVLKCAACGHLNEEGSKFCQECGRSM